MSGKKECPQCKGKGMEKIMHRGEVEWDVCDCDHHIKRQKEEDEEFAQEMFFESFS